MGTVGSDPEDEAEGVGTMVGPESVSVVSGESEESEGSDEEGDDEVDGDVV